jgi:hypothetical protein
VVGRLQLLGVVAGCLEIEFVGQLRAAIETKDRWPFLSETRRAALARSLRNPLLYQEAHTLMQAFRHWSFGKVLLASVAWVLLSVVVAVSWLLFPVVGIFFDSSGSGGIGAVDVAINLAMLSIPVVVPPIALILAWSVARRRDRQSSKKGRT